MWFFNKEKEYVCGLVLSGGGARGIAHVGVIQALHEQGIFPDVISGVSAGAIVGAFYADGYEPREIIDLFAKKGLMNFFGVTIPHKGLLKISGLTSLLKQNLRANTFEELHKKLYVAATNYHTGQADFFERGPLRNIIIASSSIPVIFTPAEIDGKTYIDGGVTNNMPVEPIEKSCDMLVGSFVNPLGYVESCKGIVDVAERAFNLSILQGVASKKKLFDLYIEPMELRDYGLLDISKAKEIYEIGYREAKKQLKKKKWRKL